jgi:hypothetical protein
VEGGTGGGDGAVCADIPMPMPMPKGFLNEDVEEVDEVEFEGPT